MDVEGEKKINFMLTNAFLIFFFFFFGSFEQELMQGDLQPNKLL